MFVARLGCDSHDLHLQKHGFKVGQIVSNNFIYEASAMLGLVLAIVSSSSISISGRRPC
jgi:hypothetical protein